MSELFIDPDEWDAPDEEKPLKWYEAAADFAYAFNLLIEVLRKEVRRQKAIEIYWSSFF